MRGDQAVTTADPTVQRHGLLGDQEALLQQPQQPRPLPRPRPAMQQQPPQGFLVAAGTGMPPSQGSAGRLVSAETTAAQAEAARTRAAEQMAFEDAWKALNPDFRTPFASVEDAVSRLLPYHVFADYEEDDDDVVEPINGGGSSSISTTTEKSSAQIWDDDMEAQVEGFIEHFEKQLLTFNVMTQQHAAGFNRTEEQLIMERSVVEAEHRQLERVRAAVAQHQQQEAVRARLALAQAQAQAQAAGGWQAAQPAASLQAFVPAGRGEGASRGQALAAPAMVMQQQQQQHETMMTAGAWQALAAAVSCGEGGSNEQALIHAVMVQHMQRQRQQEEILAAAASRGEGASFGQAVPPATVTQTQLMLQHTSNQQRQQEEMMTAAFRGEVAPGGEQAMASAVMMRQLQQLQQQHHYQQEVMAAGGWQLGGRQAYAVPRGDGSSSSQAALPPAMLQQPGQGRHASTAGSGLALPWHGIPEEREQ